jgi:uncharacterized membrane protein
MTTMVGAVLIFAVLNYALKAAGPVMLMGHNLSDRMGTIIEALPSALLTGMLVSSIVGQRGAEVDPTVLAGLGCGTLAWFCKAPHILSVTVSVVVVIAIRWVSQ